MSSEINMERLIAIASQLEPDALEVWLQLGERLVRGQLQYGRLDHSTDTRDWSVQALEEVLDCNVYVQLLLWSLRRGHD